jgi:hypothetical protein
LLLCCTPEHSAGFTDNGATDFLEKTGPRFTIERRGGHLALVKNYGLTEEKNIVTYPDDICTAEKSFAEAFVCFRGSL